MITSFVHIITSRLGWLAVAPLLALSACAPSARDGRWLPCWTDQASGRVLVQASDGHRVVITSFAVDEERFQLVAASLEPLR